MERKIAYRFFWAKPLPPQAVEYTCYFIAAIMLIPPVIMAVHVFRRRADKIDSYDLKNLRRLFSNGLSVLFFILYALFMLLLVSVCLY